METDEQQVEALKKWWAEHGKTVIAGLVIGIGSVAGWNYWQSYQMTQAELASRLYTTMVDTAVSEQHPQVLEQASRLIEQHGDSNYAALASLVAARSAIATGDTAAARRNLEWVIANAKPQPMRDLGRLRLARVLQGAGDSAAALAQLDAIEAAAYRALADELRGDIRVAQGDAAAARTAYEQVLATPDLPDPSRRRVELKLDDLGRPSVS